MTLLFIIALLSLLTFTYVFICFPYAFVISRPIDKLAPMPMPVVPDASPAVDPSLTVTVKRGMTVLALTRFVIVALASKSPPVTPVALPRLPRL